MNEFDFSALPEIPDGHFVNKHNRPDTVGPDWILPAQKEYTADEDAMWDFLFNRMMKIVPDRACDQFLKGVELLNLGKGGVPRIDEINKILKPMTGWILVPTPDLVPDDAHFFHLANKRFPVGNFIRKPDQIDYLDLPDVFHDMFGHAPLLTDPDFSNFLQSYGKAGYLALKHNRLRNFAALYMHTVELGLINTDKGIRIYGAAILSSHRETLFALEGQSPNRFHMDFERMLRTNYVLSDVQQSYFVIGGFEELYNQMQEFRFEEAYSWIEPSYQFAASAILDTDKVYHRGTQEYDLRGGRFSNIEPV